MTTTSKKSKNEMKAKNGYTSASQSASNGYTKSANNDDHKAGQSNAPSQQTQAQGQPPKQPPQPPPKQQPAPPPPQSQNANAKQSKSGTPNNNNSNPNANAKPNKSNNNNNNHDNNNNSEVDKIIQRLQGLKKNAVIDLKASEIEKVCRECRSIFEQECALVRVDAPMKIVGDIHGQFYDLLRLFELGGFPNTVDSRYIFLGDYVDRGSFSLEVICLLFCYKIKYRHGFYLLRGNHECGSINRIYGFFDECKRRYKQEGVRLWKTFTDAFNFLPVAGIIDEKIFCMHGGISPYMMKKNSLNHIANIKRPTDVPDRGLLCDLLWADPDPYIDTWGPNDRGVSYVFGANILNQFLNVHDLDLVCRAHQVVEDGYEFFGNRTLVTIFSAPNYCGEFDNAGAMMSVDDTLMCSFHVLKPNYKRRTRFYQ